MEWNGGGRESSGEGLEGEGQQGEEVGHERVAKKRKMKVDNKEAVVAAKATKGSLTELESWKEQVQNMSEEEFEVF